MENPILKSAMMYAVALAIITFLIALLMMGPNASGVNDVPTIWSEVFFGISAVSFAVFLVTYFMASKGAERY